MAKLHPFVRDFIEENKRLRVCQQMREELHRLVLECKKASEDGNTRQARALLAKADRLRNRLERAQGYPEVGSGDQHKRAH